jgi:hypothetical protein
VAVIVGIGAIFSILAIIILTLSIYLLLQKNVSKLENLVLIGYKPMYVAMPYIIMTVALNLSILIVSIAAVSYAQVRYIDYIESSFGISIDASPSTSIITGGIVAVVITIFNLLVIYRKIAEISRKRC